MKKSKFLGVLVAVLALSLGFSSCSSDADTTAPSDVSNLEAINLDGSVQLTWKDPSDEDLFGIQITYTDDSLSRAIIAMEEGSIFIAPGTQSAVISNLTNGNLYTFTVKAMDTNGNKSDGMTMTISPSVIQKNIMQVTLTPGTTEAINGDVSVSIKVIT